MMKFEEQNFHFPILGILGRNLYGRTKNFEILTFDKSAEEKCYQICSMVKFVEQNWTK
jgi:hypothetical protein